jgi:hypothetical protein
MVAAPQPPFDLPLPFRVIRTIGEMRETGRRLNNCLKSGVQGVEHWIALAGGSSIYVTSDDPPLIATVNRCGAAYWIQEVRGPQNRAVDPAIIAELADALSKAGVTALEDSPTQSVAYLSYESQHRFTRESDEDVEFNDLLDEVEDR